MTQTRRAYDHSKMSEDVYKVVAACAERVPET